MLVYHFGKFRELVQKSRKFMCKYRQGMLLTEYHEAEQMELFKEDGERASSKP